MLLWTATLPKSSHRWFGQLRIWFAKVWSIKSSRILDKFRCLTSLTKSLPSQTYRSNEELWKQVASDQERCIAICVPVRSLPESHAYHWHSITMPRVTSCTQSIIWISRLGQNAWHKKHFVCCQHVETDDESTSSINRHANFQPFKVIHSKEQHQFKIDNLPDQS